MIVTETDENLTKPTDFGVTKHQTGKNAEIPESKTQKITKTMMLPVVLLQLETLQQTNWLKLVEKFTNCKLILVLLNTKTIEQITNKMIPVTFCNKMMLELLELGTLKLADQMTSKWV